jgi:hypothetical protein
VAKTNKSLLVQAGTESYPTIKRQNHNRPRNRANSIKTWRNCKHTTGAVFVTVQSWFPKKGNIRLKVESSYLLWL